MTRDAEIEAALKDPENADLFAETVIQALEIKSALEKMSAERLVDVALAVIVNLSQHEEMILMELCSRIDPNWSDRDPSDNPGAKHGD
jgi:hypothetical protein